MNFDTYDGRVDPIVALYAHDRFPGGNIDRFIGPLDLDKIRVELASARTVTQALAETLAARNKSIEPLNLPGLLGADSTIQIVPSGQSPLNPAEPEGDTLAIDLFEESWLDGRDATDVLYLVTDTAFGKAAIPLTTVGGGDAPQVAHEVVIRAEPGSGNMVTHITRKSTIDLDPSNLPEEFLERIAMVTDPRTWMLATGERTGSPQAGWMQSRPVRPSYDADDASKQPAEDDALPGLVSVPTGMPWGAPFLEDENNPLPVHPAEPQALYELVWPGFNRPWGIILEVSYQHRNAAGVRIEPTTLTEWNELRVEYRLKQHLEAPGGPFGRRPVGPSLQSVTVDDGYMTVVKRDDLGRVVYDVEMYKQLAFKDIVKHRVFDTFEEAMPFLAGGWFHSVNAQWIEALFDTEAFPTAELDQKWKELPFEPAYDERRPVTR